MQYESDGETYFEVVSISRDDLNEHFADDDIAEAVKKLSNEDIEVIANQMGHALFTSIFWQTLDEVTRAHIAKQS